MISIGTANEKGTCIITCAFTDDDGIAVTPKTLKWTLVDNLGNVINEREQVEVSSLSTSVDIVLSGDDLAATVSENTKYFKRFLVVEATYDSTSGSDLPLKDEALFHIKNLKYVITEKCGIAYARNEALRICDTDILAFTDDDCIVSTKFEDGFSKTFAYNTTNAFSYSCTSCNREKWDAFVCSKVVT